MVCFLTGSILQQELGRAQPGFSSIYQSVNFWSSLTRTVRKKAIKVDLYRMVDLNHLITVAVAGYC